MSSIEVPKGEKSSASRQLESQKQQQQQKYEVPDAKLIMDPRLPYNMEYVVCTLLQTLAGKGILTVSEARRIMSSGESYLH